MLTIVIRAILIYVIVLIVFRVMGKRQIGQMQPFELVLTLIIADLATIPMAEISVPVLHGVVPLLTLVALHFIITFICKRSTTLEKIVSGRPVVLINPNGIDYDALKKINLSLDDLFFSLRECGYFSIEEIQYAIIETNGKISVMPKDEFTPASKKDMGCKIEETLFQTIIINNGKIIDSSLVEVGIDLKEVEKIIKRYSNNKNIPIKQILILTLDKNGKGYFQLKKGRGVNFVWNKGENK